jgi:hypothetical protein
MAITADDVATALNANGIDTTEKLQKFLGQSGLLVRRQALDAAIEKARADQQAAVAAAEAEVQQLADERAAVDVQIKATL